jgi:hypothetical protein
MIPGLQFLSNSKKCFALQSVRAKKYYRTPLIIFSNASICSLNAFSPALVIE